MKLEDFIVARCENISLVCPHPDLVGNGSSLHLYREFEAKSAFGDDGWIVDGDGKYAEKTVDGIRLSYDVKP